MHDEKILFARHLRKHMTDAEKKLWRELRGDQFGVRFRRQVPLGPYVIDFACFSPRIAIEIDGGQHGDHHIQLYDMKRTDWLRSYGYVVLRFWNSEVLTQIEIVKEEILRNLSLHPNLPPVEEGIK
jgi:very-short-patch-repair endonuclease